MTLEEKRSVIKKYCSGRECDRDKCVVCRVAQEDYEAGITDSEVCYSTDSEELLDKRIAAIEAETKSEIRSSKISQCIDLCEARSTCDECPCSDIADRKHDGDCEFDEFTEEDLDEYIKCFSNERSAKELAAISHPRKVAPATETSLKDAIHPHHYKLPGGMQVIDVEVAMFGREAVMAHCLCTAAEYILRSRQKNGVEDIKKAHWWLCKYIELEAESHGK